MLSKSAPEKQDVNCDELNNYTLLLFKLCALHQNLDSAVDMGYGRLSVRSAKYEPPVSKQTNKTKYLIGSIHLTYLVSGTLLKELTVGLVWNRFINVSEGKSNNMAIDKYVEQRHKSYLCQIQTKEIIIAHSKDFPLLLAATKHFDKIFQVWNYKL